MTSTASHAIVHEVMVPRLCPDGTVVCLGTGPSLARDDVEYCHGKATVIAINDAYRLAPWADVLYACDEKWWRWHWQAASKFEGLKYALNPRCTRFPGVRVLRNDGEEGLSLDPTALKTGKSSGYQALNFAVLAGAARVVLLGYDMNGDHFFGKHPDGSRPPFQRCLACYSTMVKPLQDAGVSVINASRKSALTVFPRQPLREVLS